MDGESLIMLALKGQQHQLVSCGVNVIGDQLKLRKLIEDLKARDSAEEAIELMKARSAFQRKPSGRAISTELHKRIYNAK